MARATRFDLRSGLVLSLLALGGCYDVKTVDPGHARVPIVADATGWVDADSNPFGLAGVWYAYGDQYPTVPRCTEIGFHLEDVGDHGDDECSFVAWPDAWAEPELGTGKFPNSGNRLCTYGNTAQVTGCHTNATEWCGDDPSHDYANMWGAGIGLQFNVSSGGSNGSGGAAAIDSDAGVSPGWDAPAHGLIGVAFDFEWTDPSVSSEPFLRVEFPVVLPPEGLLLTTDTVNFDARVWHAGESLPEGYTSEVHPSGSPFVDAPPVWGKSGVPNDPSLVVVGHNEVLWSDAKGAPSNEKDYAYPFYPENLIGIQFHVPAIKDYRIPYGFCVSNLAFLRK